MMSYSRKSKIVKFGRLFQKLSQHSTFLDYPFRFFRKKSSIPVVIIAAPPRSGSTLTYQLLITGIRSFNLTNIWNLLYATPTIGGVISQRLCKGYQSKFNSDCGFVPGICGEAEGLKFWSYWSGQTLSENRLIDKKRLKEFAGIIQKIGKDDNSFICGYLGHVFCMEELRQVFPRVIFVHLTRDLLSNAYSLYRLSRDMWFSTRPKEYEKLKELPRYQQAVEQVILIHERIVEQSRPQDTMQISYHQVCQNPKAVISKIIDFAKEHDIILHWNDKIIPENFIESRVEPNLNEDTLQINEYIIDKLKEKQFIREMIL